MKDKKLSEILRNIVRLSIKKETDKFELFKQIDKATKSKKCNGGICKNCGELHYMDK